MTPATTQANLTARGLLLGDAQDGVAVLRDALSEYDVLKQCGGELPRLTRDASQAAGDALASATASAIDLDLGDALVYAWRAHGRLADAAKQTMRVPGRQEVVQLASHQVTSTHHPAVDLLVDGVRVHTFRFELTVVFDVQVAAAIVEAGRLTALRAGDTSVTAELTLEAPGGDVHLLRRQRRIDLHLIVHLGSGVPLLSAGTVPAPAP